MLARESTAPQIHRRRVRDKVQSAPDERIEPQDAQPKLKKRPGFAGIIEPFHTGFEHRT